jgi:hypothetical protein
MAHLEKQVTNTKLNSARRDPYVELRGACG